MYESIWILLNNYIFGGSVGVGDGSFQELALTLGSMIACIAMTALPFVLVYRIIRLL